MEKRLVDPNYRFRPPRRSAFWARLLLPIQRAVLQRRFRVKEVEIRGREHVMAATDGGKCSAMITPNHPAHGDPFVICEVNHRLELSCCFMASWHVFEGPFGLRGWAFQRLGAFSVDREGTDLRAFRTAVDLLTDGPHSLVIFPEGEVYHLNDLVTPLREGAAMIALSAAKRRAKNQSPPLQIVPCAIKYFYLEDPTHELLAVMDSLERRIHWRPQPELSLPERIYRYAGAMLALKELEYLSEARRGSIPQRVAALSEAIMCGVETRRLGAPAPDDPLPLRVKQTRVRILKELGLDSGAEKEERDKPPAPSALNHEAVRQAQCDLDDLHLVMQLFSYPGDYVAQAPTLERIAETIDKFEEDALGRQCAGARAPRKAVVSFGEPINLADFGAGEGGRRAAARDAAGQLTCVLQTRMQQLLNQMDWASSASRPGPALRSGPA